MTGVVTAVYDVPVGEVWKIEKLERLKRLCYGAGLEMEVIESIPVHEDIKLGKPTRDKLIANYAQNIINCGKVGVKCVCYNFMPVFDWFRTNLYYKHADGSIWMFRPDANAERFQNSAKRLYLPELPVDDFIGSCAALVKRDAAWVPSRREYTLYLRPFMFASEPFLGVRAAQEVDYCVIASPSGPYFQGESRPVSIWVEDKWFRTGPGGTGFAKCGGNYAASLIGEYKGIENGCEQVCFVDAATKTYLEELGGMNMMIVHKDGHIETPSLTGNILPGVTRRSLIQLAQDKGHDVVETMIKLDDLLEDIKSGEVTEVFACGTAAIIAPIGRFKSEKFDVTVAGGEPGELTMDLRNTLLGIQLGEIEDPHNWMWKVC